jgi:hypothetical protein
MPGTPVSCAEFQVPAGWSKVKKSSMNEIHGILAKINPAVAGTDLFYPKYLIFSY